MIIFELSPTFLFEPPVRSVTMRDILDSVESKNIILKIDVEGFECKALQPEILQNKVGKFIPYIFMEWGQLPNNNKTCSHFSDWVQNFYEGGYVAVNPGESIEVVRGQPYRLTFSSQKLWRSSKTRRGTRCGTLLGCTSLSSSDQI